VTDDATPRHDEHAELSFPPPPRPRAAPPSSFPRIPQGPPPRAAEPARDQTPKVAVVALIAALVGALLGTGGSLLYLGDRIEEAARPQAAPVVTGDDTTAVIESDEDDGDAEDGNGAGGEEVESIDRVAAVAEAVLPAVVQVNIRGSGLVGTAGNGSGVVYRDDGHIITNNHVVAGADRLEVLFADGSRTDATIIGTDVDTDLAVIKVDQGGLTAITIGDSSRLRVGELAVALGSPFGLEGTVTSGVISSLNRQIRVGAPDGAALTLPNVIQTDAPINPGNSGGALVNGRGELIGINSAILTQGGTAANAGVGFAIPVNIATEIADQLIEQGFVQHPFLGVAGVDVNREIAGRLGVEDGAYIEQVVPGTPAADAGLREGDVIVEIAGESIGSMQDLIGAVLRQDVGDAVDITYIRDGQEQTTQATLTEKPRG
jgi:putative serine protease PepD